MYCRSRLDPGVYNRSGETPNVWIDDVGVLEHIKPLHAIVTECRTQFVGGRVP